MGRNWHIKLSCTFFLGIFCHSLYYGQTIFEFHLLRFDSVNLLTAHRHRSTRTTPKVTLKRIFFSPFIFYLSRSYQRIPHSSFIDLVDEDRLRMEVFHRHLCMCNYSIRSTGPVSYQASTYAKINENEFIWGSVSFNQFK